MTAFWQTLGYVEEIDTSGRNSIADCFPQSKNRCGIYLLALGNDLYYIGQAKDVVKRFGQHLKTHGKIDTVWFKPVPQKQLTDVEKMTIAQAEEIGLKLTNIEFATFTYGDTDLDVLVTPDEQEAWLNGTYSPEARTVNDDAQRIRYVKKFEALQESPNYDMILRILHKYITRTIPYPERTEMSFWNMSCLPSTNANTFPRYTGISLNNMETLVFGYYPNNHDVTWGFVNIEGSTIGSFWNSLSMWFKYGTIVRETDYKAGGNDQVRIDAISLDALDRILDEPRFIDGAKALNLRLMRKGGTVYARYHCFDLADAVFSLNPSP